MSNEPTYSLEEILAMQENEVLSGYEGGDDNEFFSDDEIDDDVNSLKVPPTTPPPITDEEEDVEEEDDDEPTQPATVPVTPVLPTTEGGEEVADELKGLLEKSYTLLDSEGVLFTDEDYEFDGTPESFKAAIEQTKVNLHKSLSDDLWKIIPEVIKGKEDQYLVDFDRLNLEDTDVQKQLIINDLKINTSFSEQKIQSLVDRTEDMGLLQEEALEAVERLRVNQEEMRAEAAKQALEIRKQAERQFAERREQLAEAIKESQVINGRRKSKVEAFMFNDVKREDGVATDYVRKLREVSKNPKHEAELANLLVDYDKDKGFNYERFSKVEKSKKVDEFQEKLNDIFNVKDRVKGQTPTTTQDKFDFEMWHKQHEGDIYE